MKDSNNFIKVAFVDDHVLIRMGLVNLINKFEGCRVIHQSSNGKELIKAILAGLVPDIVILDVSMPHMDGHQTARWLNKHYPDINVLMLSRFDSELSLIRLLQCGVKGFVKK